MNIPSVSQTKSNKPRYRFRNKRAIRKIRRRAHIELATLTIDWSEAWCFEFRRHDQQRS